MSGRAKAIRILAELRSLGGKVVPANGSIIFQAPAVISPELIEQTRRHKREIENLLLHEFTSRWLCFEPEDVQAAISDDVEPLWPDGFPGDLGEAGGG